ncbi:MAG: 4-hydroxythreonine-4-phosphate dehydrogenase PdxA [Ignavibacteria bacterium GWB2_35_6b]|nr:MAG: 4-hydroxythreonine-4-phosphate dehydrogenase PdxA [Ignavibacteria bacterium GWB2_35_6b]
MNRIVFTCGDINGIGPEICLKTILKLYNPQRNKFIIAVPQNVFSFYQKELNSALPFEIQKSYKKFNSNPNLISVIDIGNSEIKFGRPTAASGKLSYKSIQTAFELIKYGYADAMVTAPISKTAFEKAGVNFPGHTELLAEWGNIKNYAMTFISKKMKCALITIHEPLILVSKKISKEKIKSVITTAKNSLVRDFNITNPRIAVLGLNPHAGENGRIGNKEITIIKPALKELAFKNLEGPFVPDAFFANKLYKNYDMIIGMYHDQVLIPFKMMNFHSGVNYTAGLNFIRTSPDHGTAFDIAGKNIADPSSIIEAVKVAETIIKNRRKFELHKTI